MPHEPPFLTGLMIGVCPCSLSEGSLSSALGDLQEEEEEEEEKEGVPAFFPPPFVLPRVDVLSLEHQGLKGLEERLSHLAACRAWSSARDLASSESATRALTLVLSLKSQRGEGCGGGGGGLASAVLILLRTGLSLKSAQGEVGSRGGLASAVLMLRTGLSLKSLASAVLILRTGLSLKSAQGEGSRGGLASAVLILLRTGLSLKSAQGEGCGGGLASVALIFRTSTGLSPNPPALLFAAPPSWESTQSLSPLPSPFRSHLEERGSFAVETSPGAELHTLD